MVGKEFIVRDPLTGLYIRYNVGGCTFYNYEDKTVIKCTIERNNGVHLFISEVGEPRSINWGRYSSNSEIWGYRFHIYHVVEQNMTLQSNEEDMYPLVKDYLLEYLSAEEIERNKNDIKTIIEIVMGSLVEDYNLFSMEIPSDKEEYEKFCQKLTLTRVVRY